MVTMDFDPEVRDMGLVPSPVTIADLANETSVYAASPQFVREHCGPIGIAILDTIPASWFDQCADLGLLPNIDVRVHRLNRGEFPAVPGWHCDGGMRETYFAQPDLDRVPIRNTVICNVDSGPEAIAPTEILTESVTLSINPAEDEFQLWRAVHDALVLRGRLATTLIRPGQIVQIGARTLHRCTPAATRGWRLFWRMSMWHNPYLGEAGAVARQQQVYVLHEGNGW